MTDGTQPDNSLLSRITKTLKEKHSIAICLPAQPPLDAVAAALALQLVLEKDGKSVALACPTEIDPKFSLLGQEKVQTSLAVDGDVLVVSIPYKDGNVDNVTYNVEGDRLNIVITPEDGHARLEPEHVDFKYTGGRPDAIITVYAPTLQSLGSIYEKQADQFTGTEIINIDRHFTNNDFGTINFVDKKSPSLSQMVNDIFRHMKVEVGADVASLLLDGLSAATNNFASHAVNAQTFRMAAFLLEHGAVKRPPMPVAHAGMNGGLPQMGQPMAQSVGQPFSQPMPQPMMQQMPPSMSSTMGQPMAQPMPLMEEDFMDDDFGDLPIDQQPLQLKPQIFKGGAAAVAPAQAPGSLNKG